MSDVFQEYVTHSVGHLDVLWSENTEFQKLYYKNEGCYRPENLQKEMYLGCFITRGSGNLRDSAILHFRILIMSGENKEY